MTFYSWAYGHTNISMQCCYTDPGHCCYTDWRKISNAPELFGKADNENASHPSYQWVASPLGDKINIVWWAEAVLAAQQADNGGRPLGFIDTSWVSDPTPEEFGDLKTVGECSWNLEDCIATIPH
eukprot:COSAG06_NODE_3391_length_5412_cov_79.977037_4_plen_125_part_00